MKAARIECNGAGIEKNGTGIEKNGTGMTDFIEKKEPAGNSPASAELLEITSGSSRPDTVLWAMRLISGMAHELQNLRVSCQRCAFTQVVDAPPFRA